MNVLTTTKMLRLTALVLAMGCAASPRAKERGVGEPVMGPDPSTPAAAAPKAPAAAAGRVPKPSGAASAARVEGSRAAKHALLIGIERYPQGIPSLDYAVDDGQALYRALTEEGGAGYPPRNVRVLFDERATREAIEAEIAALNE